MYGVSAIKYTQSDFGEYYMGGGGKSSFFAKIVKQHNPLGLGTLGYNKSACYEMNMVGKMFLK